MVQYLVDTCVLRFQGRQAMEWVIGKISEEAHHLSRVANEEMSEFTRVAKEEMSEFTRAAKEEMSGLTRVAKEEMTGLTRTAREELSRAAKEAEERSAFPSSYSTSLWRRLPWRWTFENFRKCKAWSVIAVCGVPWPQFLKKSLSGQKKSEKKILFLTTVTVLSCR